MRRTLWYAPAAVFVTIAALLVGVAPPLRGQEQSEKDDPPPDGLEQAPPPAAPAADATVEAQAPAKEPNAEPARRAPEAEATAPAAEHGEPARLTWDGALRCLQLPDGTEIRAQCTQAPDGSDRVCRYSGTHQILRGGGKGHALERVGQCSYPREGMRDGYQRLVDEGYRFVPAIAEAPPGWHRDVLGRVFQVNFDLHDRFWIGARWVPEYSETGGLGLSRAGIDVGLRAELFDEYDLVRHRFRVLVGEVTLNPFSARGTLFHYDDSHETDTPFLRISTFWGDPARHDLYLNLGWWIDVLGVDHRPWDSPDETHLRFLAVGGSWDLWHSADLYDYLRIRVGGAFEDLYQRGRDGPNELAVTPLVALDFDLTFDDAGFHRLEFTTGYEVPYVWREAGGDAPVRAQRFLSELAYEWILLAINDQPLTLRLSVAGGYRDDVAPDRAGWGVQAGAGLRFSFWAPPREPYSARPARGE